MIVQNLPNDNILSLKNSNLQVSKSHHGLTKSNIKQG